MSLACSIPATAQTRSGSMTYAEGWKYAFSPEGRQEWRPEFTLREDLVFYNTGLMLSGGVRIDDKRTFGLVANMNTTYYDAYPIDAYQAGLSLYMRRYFHLGPKRIISIYSDIYGGAGVVYRVDGANPPSAPSSVQQKGDIVPILGWHPGVRIRIYKNLHVFVGPTLSLYNPGIHFGIGI